MKLEKTVVLVAILFLSTVASAQSKAPNASDTSPPPALTPIEMALLTIPNSALPQSDFAKRLAIVCGSLTPNTTYTPTPTPFRAADLGASGPPSVAAAAAISGLNQTCTDIAKGTDLTPMEIASLKQFRDNATVAQTRLAAILSKTTATQQTVIPPDLTSTGSLESDIIKGLANFIYDRAKQEGTLYLSRELSERLCDDTHKLLFPRVCVALTVADPPIPLSAMATYLVAAARSDLAALPDRMLAYTLHYLTKTTQAPARETLFGARIGLTYYRTVASGRTPFDVARSLHAMQVPDTIVGHDTDVLKGVKVASELLDSVQAQQGWRNVTSPSILDSRYYALGAIFSFEDAYQADGSPFGAFNVDRIADLVPVVAQYIADTVSLVTRTEAAKKATVTPASTPTTGGDFSGGGDGQTGTPSQLTMQDYTAAVSQTLSHALANGADIAQRLGIMTSSLALDVKTVSSIAEIGEQIVSKQSPVDLLMLASTLVTHIDAVAPKEISSSAAFTDVEQLLALLAQIAQAKSADEVETVLQTAGASASTYAIKYQHSMVAVGALAGIAGGWESVRPSGLGWSTSGMIGAFAPVGFTASTPLGGCFHGGVMLSVINLGSLVSARFSQDVTTTGATTTTVETTQSVKFTNVLTPGLFVTIGLARSPFTLALGTQVVPIGREVSTAAAGSTTTSNLPSIQFVGALSMDVPLFVF
jgi:hypothetical protein